MTSSPPRRARFVGAVTAALAGCTATVVFPTGFTFALVFAVATGIAGWSMVRRWEIWGAGGNLWAGALVGFGTSAAIAGVQRLPVPLDVRLSVSFLVLSVSIASAGLAIELVYEATGRRVVEKPQDVTGPGSSDSDGQ